MTEDRPDRLVRADALELSRSLAPESLDLVYLDPPFGVGRKHAALKGRNSRFGLENSTAYADPKSNDGSRLPPFLEPLCEQIRLLLRPGGVLFLHLDWRSIHQGRILLDRIFGTEGFLNEIIWRYATGGIARRWFARKHDTILFYAKEGAPHTFHLLKEKKYLAHKMSRKGVPEFRDARGWYRYRYLDDVWEIPWLTQDAKERTGYPTQKPLALLERILEAASNPGDRVADFCCGSGTTAVAARKLGRRWIAGDASELALQVGRERLEKMVPEGDGEVRQFLVEDWISSGGERVSSGR